MSSLNSVMKEKNKLPVELLTAEKAKKAYYLTQKLPEQVGTCGGTHSLTSILCVARSSEVLHYCFSLVWELFEI